LKIINSIAGLVIENLLHFFDIEVRKNEQKGLLEFCNKICGERKQQYITQTIIEDLAPCLNFERACILNLESNKLFRLKLLTNDTDNILIDGIIELPLALGMTGEAISKRKVIISSFGKNDALYNEHIDNILKLRDINNIMIIPLIVENIVIGVLQLINYLPGDIKIIKDVMFDVKCIGEYKIDNRYYSEVYMECSRINESV